MEQNTLLKMVGITKTFPGVKALDGVNLEVQRGTVHALMGENGAGKSTLMKCLFGMYVKDGGQIYLEGKEINFKNSKEALDNGVAMVYYGYAGVLEKDRRYYTVDLEDELTKLCDYVSENGKVIEEEN